MIRHNKMFSSYVGALRNIVDWNIGNLLGAVLPNVEHLNASQVDELVAAYNETPELRHCFAFNGKSIRRTVRDYHTILIGSERGSSLDSSDLVRPVH